MVTDNYTIPAVMAPLSPQMALVLAIEAESHAHDRLTRATIQLIRAESAYEGALRRCDQIALEGELLDAECALSFRERDLEALRDLAQRRKDAKEGCNAD